MHKIFMQSHAIVGANNGELFEHQTNISYFVNEILKAAFGIKRQNKNYKSLWVLSAFSKL